MMISGLFVTKSDFNSWIPWMPDFTIAARTFFSRSCKTSKSLPAISMEIGFPVGGPLFSRSIASSTPAKGFLAKSA